MPESPAPTATTKKLFCPRCERLRPATEFRVLLRAVRQARAGSTAAVTVLVHRPCKEHCVVFGRVRARAGGGRDGSWLCYRVGTNRIATG